VSSKDGKSLNDGSAPTNGKLDSMLVMGAPGKLYSLFGYNAGAQQWIHIFDAKTQPANGAVPMHSLKVAVTDNWYVIVPASGINFSTGLVVCVSTTDTTLTLGAKDSTFLVTIAADV
jgi:hypothetical protein